jgi:hypothetical protein
MTFSLQTEALDTWIIIDALIVVLLLFLVVAGVVWFVRRKRPVADAADAAGQMGDPAAPDVAGGGLAEPELAPTDEKLIERAEKVSWPQGVPTPPRGNEIPENPLLPDEDVKIRCLACDKKMRAPGTKFSKQRRCPNCHAMPFRYVVAPDVK